MRALLVNNDADRPKMEMGEYPTPKPSDLELLVRIHTTALNRADLMQKAGKYPPPKGESELLGLEMSGIVESVGQKVTRFKPGDFVFGLLGGGGYAEYCVIHEEMAISKTENLSFEEAAAIPEVFLTAFQAMIWLGRLKENETILIHAGASGVGTAAIQLAKQLRNATIIVTAGSGEKLELCKELGADLMINYKQIDFAEVIEKKLDKNKVDVIIDFVGSPYWDGNIRSLNTDGRVVYLSMLGGATVEKMSIVPILKKRLTIQGSTLRNRSFDYKKRLTSDFYCETSDLFKQGKLKPVIDSIFSWKEVEAAHKRMENNRNAGKIVLNSIQYD